MRKIRTLTILALAAALSLFTGTIGASAATETVDIVGEVLSIPADDVPPGGLFVANEEVQVAFPGPSGLEGVKVTFRFDSGDVSVKRNDSVRWVNMTTPPEPHTVTLVPAGERLPSSLADVFACGGPGGPPLDPSAWWCNVLSAHFGGSAILPNGATAAGGGWTSLLINPGATLMAKITLSKGSHPYICVIHPWMQGTIDVE